MLKHEAAPTQNEALTILNELFELEMAGIVRYLHYSFMIMGYNRIPIQKWFRDQANESMLHTILIGEKITSLGGHPPVVSAGVHEASGHSVETILRESLEFEEQGLELYRRLARVAAEMGDIPLEELAREQVRSEQEHVDEVRKMLRPPR
jgi:bacterioferritin